MAVNFVNAGFPIGQTTYAHLELAAPIVTGPPFTFFSWFNPTLFASANGAAIMTVQGTSFPGNDRIYSLFLTYQSSALPNRVAMTADGVLGFPRIAYSATEYSLNQWQSAAGVVASHTSVKAYLNGVSGTENTDTSADISAFLTATAVGASFTQFPGTYVAPIQGCYAYTYAWDIDLSDAEIALLHAGATPNTIQPGHLIMGLDLLTPATAGDNGAGSTFTIFDPLSRISQCPDEPPIEPPEPPVPSLPANPGYYIERMDNRIWPTIEDAWCLDSALRYPMPMPDATLSASSATGGANITEYNLINGGSGYTSPIAQIIDLAGTGSGALCSLGVSGGVIVSATAVATGADYRHPQVSILDTTGVGGVVQPIITNYVTFSATSTGSDWVNFTSSDVGSIIRMGGGQAEIVSYSSTTSVIANILVPITQTVPNDPYNAPVPAVSGNWSMTAPTMTVSGLDHLEGLTVAALADGGVVPDLTVTAGSVTLPVAATSIVVGLPFVAQLQTMYMDLGGGPTVQTRRKDVTQVVLRVESSRAPEIGLNQPDAAAQPGQAIVPWGVYPYTGMTQIVFRTPDMPAGLPAPLYSGDLSITNVFSTWDAKGQVAVQQTQCVPLSVTGLISWLKVGDSTGQ